MNNKFRIKFVFLLGAITVFSLAHIASAYIYSGVLKLGSTGPDVVDLQEKLGVDPTGDFDYTTRGAVVTFQISVGLVADGIVGPVTGQALSDEVVPPTPPSTPTPKPSPKPTPKPTPAPAPSIYPEGCVSGEGFSATTGNPCTDPLLPPGCTSRTGTSPVTKKPCATNIVYPVGCKSNAGYSTTTGLKCSMPIGCDADSEFSSITGESCDTIATPFVPGCISHTTGYSATTGASCLTGKKSVPLVGTEGLLEHFTKASGFLKPKTIPENKLNSPFAGYVVNGEQDSDIQITSMTISLKLTSGDGSSNLNKYAKAINITQSSKVGTKDVSDFSKDSDGYSARIPLYGAIVRSDKATNFNITADTLENISSDNTNNTWTVTVTQVQYMNGRGSSFTDSSKGDIGKDGSIDFHFQPAKN